MPRARRIPVVVALVACTSALSWAGAARADCEVRRPAALSPDALVDGVEVLSGDCSLGELTLGVVSRAVGTSAEPCSVQVRLDASGRLRPVSSDCPAGADPWSGVAGAPGERRAWTLAFPADAPAPLLSAEVTVVREPVVEATLDRFAGRALEFRHSGAESRCTPERILVRGEDGWRAAALSCDALGIDQPTFWRCTGGPWYADADGQSRCTDAAAELPRLWSRQCEDQEVQHDDEVVVCIDARERADLVRPEGRRVVAPHQDITVFVLHRRSRRPQVRLNGERGYEPPRMRDEGIGRGGLMSAAAEAAREREDEREAGELLVTPFRFVPRRPGVVDLSVKLDDEAYEFELIVDQRYLGSVRLGIGAVTFGAVDRAYRASLRPGSMQAEIVAERFDDVDLELVLGFSLFVLELPRGGRGYLVGPNYFVAPYVGLGLIGEGAGGTRALTSIWGGIEIELTPSTSIAIGAVLRRVTRLANGYDVGDAVDVDTRFTSSRIGIGGGILVNVSPEFARVAGLPGVGGGR